MGTQSCALRKAKEYDQYIHVKIDRLGCTWTLVLVAAALCHCDERTTCWQNACWRQMVLWIYDLIEVSKSLTTYDFLLFVYHYAHFTCISVLGTLPVVPH